MSESENLVQEFRFPSGMFEEITPCPHVKQIEIISGGFREVISFHPDYKSDLVRVSYSCVRHNPQTMAFEYDLGRMFGYRGWTALMDHLMQEFGFQAHTYKTLFEFFGKGLKPEDKKIIIARLEEEQKNREAVEEILKAKEND